MHLAIHSLKRTLFDGEAQSVNVATAAGEVTVLDHHRPLISMLRPGVVAVKTESGEKFFNIQSGFMEVMPGNAVRLLVDEAAD